MTIMGEVCVCSLMNWDEHDNLLLFPLIIVRSQHNHLSLVVGDAVMN